jgi:predicted ATP-grasp superfamily ATP-dependent carboligase
MLAHSGQTSGNAGYMRMAGRAPRTRCVPHLHDRRVSRAAVRPRKGPDVNSSDPPRVLLTDAQDRSSLAGCRSLHRAGYAVDALATGRPAAAHWSRHCDRRLTATDPREDQGRFVTELTKIVRGTGYRLLVTGSDASLLAISRHRERLEPYVELGLPPADVVERCLSKETLARAANQVGLGSPETEVCGDEGEARAAAARFGYPVVLKPRSTVSGRNGRVRQRPSSLVGDDASLAALVTECGTPCLIQRHEDGTVLSFSGVAADGRLLAHGVSRYTRTWPPEGGAVSFAETIPSPPELHRKVCDLLAVLGWQGVFELEVIQRRDTGFAAIDFNPRLFGSLELITRAGAPLAAVWSDWVMGRDRMAAEARAGYHYRWEDAELRNLWRRVRDGQVGSAADILRPRRRMTRSFLRVTDPAPLVARLVLLASHRRARSHPAAEPKEAYA